VAGTYYPLIAAQANLADAVKWTVWTLRENLPS
jgi:hypothetical protein